MPTEQPKPPCVEAVAESLKADPPPPVPRVERSKKSSRPSGEQKKRARRNQKSEAEKAEGKVAEAAGPPADANVTPPKEKRPRTESCPVPPDMPAEALVQNELRGRLSYTITSPELGNKVEVLLKQKAFVIKRAGPEGSKPPACTRFSLPDMQRFLPCTMHVTRCMYKLCNSVSCSAGFRGRTSLSPSFGTK